MIVKQGKKIGKDSAEVLIWVHGRWGLPSYGRKHNRAVVWENKR